MKLEVAPGLVTAEVDGGPIIAQKPVTIEPADTLESLTARMPRSTALAFFLMQ